MRSLPIYMMDLMVNSFLSFLIYCLWLHGTESWNLPTQTLRYVKCVSSTYSPGYRYTDQEEGFHTYGVKVAECMYIILALIDLSAKLVHVIEKAGPSSFNSYTCNDNVYSDSSTHSNLS